MKPEILLIDDEIEILEILKALFEEENYTVVTASNPIDAKTIIATHCPPLIISDINMPYQTGLDLLLEIRKQGFPSAVVMITANDEKDKIIQALQLGVLDYIVKPFNIEELLKRVPVWMELGKKLQEISHTENASPEALQRQLRTIELFKLKNLSLSKQ